MKLLYWTWLHWPDIGGVEVVAMQTIPQLRKMGFEIEVLAAHGAFKAPDFTVQDGVPVHRFHFYRAIAQHDLPALLDLSRKIEAIKSRFSPDILHVNLTGVTAFHFLRSQQKRRVPALVTVHSDFSAPLQGEDSVVVKSLRAGDWVAAVSRSTLEDTLCLAPELRARSSVIYNGAPSEEFFPIPFNSSGFHVVCAGRLVREKGFDLALEALAILAPRFPALRFSIIGRGEEKAALELQAQRLGVAERVHFVGALDRSATLQLMASANLVLVPSRYREPFALVALEAALLARPVVATKIGGLVENVDDGKGGILTENENPRALATAIESLLQNPQRAQKMGEWARKRAQKLFSIERCVGEYAALYRQIAS